MTSDPPVRIWLPETIRWAIDYDNHLICRHSLLRGLPLLCSSHVEVKFGLGQQILLFKLWNWCQTVDSTVIDNLSGECPTNLKVCVRRTSSILQRRRYQDALILVPSNTILPVVQSNRALLLVCFYLRSKQCHASKMKEQNSAQKSLKLQNAAIAKVQRVRP